MKYVFQMKYTHGASHTKEIVDTDVVDAWIKFSVWIQGFIVAGNNGVLESVKLK